MDTNQNNQLLHTFEKGMDTDTSDAWLESGKYRFALNLRYLTDIGNDTGELHSIEGWISTDINSFNVSPYPAGAVKSYGEPVQYKEYCTEGSPELYYMKTAPGIEEFDVQGRTFGHGSICCYRGTVYICIVEEGEIASDQFVSDEWRSVHLDDLVDMGYMDYRGYDAGSTILAATSIRDLGIYVVKDIFNRWFVFKQQKDSQSTTKVFGPCTESIGDGYKNKLSLVTRWEDDDNIKLYIADGEHELMVINLNGDVVYTNIESITNTTTSRLSKPEVSKYSSLSLQIVEFGKPIKTGLYYFNGIENILYNFGQLYEFVGSTNQQSIDEWELVSYGAGYYCSYENKIYKSLGTTQAAEFDSGEWVEQSINDLISDRAIEHKTLLEIPEAQVEGMLKPAIVQYSYRLYKKNQTSSVISPISAPIIIDTVKNEITYGIPHGKYSSTGVNITIDTSLAFNKYDKIIIYRIVYEVAGQDPTIDIIYDNELTSYDNKFSLNDDGRDAISTITVAEYNSYDGINIVPKTIESKGDYLFASNVEYIKQDAFKNWDARSYTTGNYYIKNGIRIYPVTDTQPLNKVPLDVTIMHENWSLSSTYDAEQWKDDLGKSYSGIGTNISWYLITEEKVLDSHASNQVGINKDSTNSTKSLQRGEIYRYAIVLYHKDGYKSEAKWIADIRIPDQSVTNEQDPITNPFKVKIEGEDPFRYKNLYAYNIGIRFSVYNLPEDCIGYEIVRADRTIADRATITQGVVSRTISPYDFDEEIKLETYRIPTGFITFDSMCFLDGSGQSAKTSYNYNKGINEELLFFSPETSYQSDDLSNIMSSYNVKLNLLNWINPLFTRISASGSSTNANIINTDNNKHYINPSILTNRLGVNTGMYFLVRDPSGDDLYLHTLYYPYSRTYEFEPETDILRHIYAINANKLTSDINASFIRSKEAYTPICYVKLYEKSNFNIDQISTDIDNSKILNSKQYSDFADSNENILILNHNVAIGLSTVSQWISPSIFKQSQLSTVKNRLKDFDKNNEYSDSLIGISGKALILKQLYTGENTNNLFYQYANKIDNLSNRSLDTFFGTFVCNIKKYTSPYGGQENSAKAGNKYISYGNYVNKELNTIDVYDGDCNLVCFECTTMHDWYHPTLNRHANMNVVYSIPLETTIDVDRDYGDRYSKLNSNSDTINRDLNFLQAEATNFREWFVQTKPMYQYNTAYSIQPFVLYYTGMSKEEIEDFKYDYRVHYSNQKTNNEQIDSWTLFKPANYLDVDTRYGEITNLRLFKDRLLFWLNEAVGVLSVNERTILQDLNDYNIILGNGDVLQRYDYITTEYGMKPDQYADGQSNTCLYWWDGYKNEILAYAGEGVIPTGRTNSIHSYLSDAGIEEDNPTLAYDDKYNEMLFSLNDYQSLVFNEVIKAYTGIYTIGFKNKVNFVNQLLLCDYNDRVNIWNQHDNNENYMPSMLLYVVNANPTYTKVYDDMLFECTPDPYGDTDSPKLEFEFNTPLKQRGKINEVSSTNCSKRERDFRMRIPRAEIYEESVWKEATVGERLRGKTMKCKLTSTTKKQPLSLQYIITKFRISWS